MNLLRRFTFVKIFVLLLLLAATVVGVYLLDVYENTQKAQQVEMMNQNIIKRTLVEKSLSDLANDATYLREVYRYSAVNRQAQKPLWLAEMTTYFSAFLKSKRYYHQIRLLDLQGKEFFRIDYQRGQTSVATESQLQDKSDRYYYEEAQKLKSGEIYLSRFDLNVENGLVQLPYVPTIRLVTPIEDERNSIVGYAVINYNGESLLDALKSNAEKQTTLLLNAESYYLIGMKASDEWGFMFDNGVTFNSHFPEVWPQLVDSEQVSLRYQDVYISSIQIEPAAIVNSDSKTGSELKWILVSYFDEENVRLAFSDYLNHFIPWLLVILFVLIILSYLVTRYVLEAFEARLRMEIANRAFENSQEGIMVLDHQRKIIQVNHAFTEITGFSETEVLNQTAQAFKFSDFQSQDFYNHLWDSLVQKGLWIGELKNIKKSGREYVENMTMSTVVEGGNIVNYIGVFSDISKQKEQQLEIEKNRDVLESSLRKLKQAQDQLIESEKLTALGQLIAGISHEINSPLGAIKASAGNVLDAMDKVLLDLPKLQGMLTEVQSSLLTQLRAQLPMEMSILSLKEKRALKKSLIPQLEAMGITEARQFADKLSQFQVSEIGDFESLLKHPEASFILDTLFNEYISISHSHNILRSVERASKTIYALKRFTHFGHSGELGCEKLQDSIENILVLLSHNLKQGVEVIKDYQDLSPIWCYPDDLTQVWMNLIQNAIQAMENKGQITISLYEDDNYQTVAIKDSGYGIPIEIQDKIFKPFFTTKSSGVGTGLGLDIVRKIIDNHQGKIHFDSNQGGTTFYVSISKNLKR